MAYEVVMTQNEWVATQKACALEINGSFYSNVYPTNCMYNHGNGVFSADCWNKDKALIWCRGNLPKNKGEYVYKPGLYGLGDWDGAKLMSCCSDVSTNMSKITPGEGLLTQAADHWGTYVGEFSYEWKGKTYSANVIEATPIWEDGIQATWVDPDGTRREYKGASTSAGKWYKHGKLPWIDYTNGAKNESMSVDVDASKYNQVVINLK